ncbi:hypothetical protein LV779_21750 [Streptomyces thinghirensis]|nr:hypothetical protein [Streptomyces thinghirensis]
MLFGGIPLDKVSDVDDHQRPRLPAAPALPTSSPRSRGVGADQLITGTIQRTTC